MEEEPIFPILFHIHKTKQGERHEEFFDIAVTIFNLDTLWTVPIVCDNEKGIKNAIIKYNLNFVLCNNHLLRATKRYLLTKTPNEISKDEMNSFLDYIGKLIDSGNPAEFKSHTEIIKKTFASKKIFFEYFNKILKDIENYSSKLVSTKYDSFKGKRATSNQSESFNRILKSVVCWDESKMDKMLLVLYHLQNAFIFEFARGFKGVRKYKPKAYIPKNLIIEEDCDLIPIDKIIEHVDCPEK